MSNTPPAVSHSTPLRVRSGRFMGLAALSLVLSSAALGAAGFLWWQQQQSVTAQQKQAGYWEETVYGIRKQTDQLAEQLSTQAKLQKTQGDSLAEVLKQRDLMQQKLDLVDRRIAAVTAGPARVDWMLAEVVHFITVSDRRLSLLGDVRGSLALLESAEEVVKTMEEPLARALRQALINDIQTLRSAKAEVIDTEGLLMRLNSTKQLVQTLEPPRLSFKSTRVETPTSLETERYGFDLFWYKVKTFTQSLVRIQKNEDTDISIVVDPEARFYLQQSVNLLLDQTQLAVLRGESTTYTLALQEATDRIHRYLRIDTPDGQRALREMAELINQPVKQNVPDIRASLLALDAFRQAWEKGRGAREAAAAKLLEDAGIENANSAVSPNKAASISNPSSPATGSANQDAGRPN